MGKSSKLFVTKYPQDYEERDVRRMFEKFGSITSVMMKKSFCFVEYNDYHDAQEAIDELNNKTMDDDLRLVVTHSTSDSRDQRDSDRGGDRKPGERY